MIKHKLYAKGEYVHALISADQNPNILFPVRALIYDVKFDDVNPQYQIKIVKFYDNIYFLKKWFFNGTFKRNFDKSTKTKIQLVRANYRDVNALTEAITGESWEKYLIVVDSVFCTKTRADQIELFNNLQSFFIELKFKEIFEFANRSVYSKGEYYWHTKGHYEKSLKKFLGDRYPDRKNFINELLYNPETYEIDSSEL